MATGGALTPHETSEGVVGRKISIGKIYFDRLLERHDIDPFLGDILFKLSARARVTTTTNVPEQLMHQIIR